MKRARAPASRDLDLPQVDIHAGAVRVSVALPIPPGEAFIALTDRAAVAQWFGDLSASLAQDGLCRLDFGDGDFFEISGIEIDPPRAVSYRWRFLGTGPSSAVAWVIVPHRGGCRVTVTDREADRDRKAAAELGEGWRDFLKRLRDHCVTGANTRYSWRREFDGSIELALDADAAAALLFDHAGQRGWMPLTADALRSGVTATSTDGARPEHFTIGSVVSAGLVRHFTLGCPEWSKSTECRIEIQHRPAGALLVVAHQGWEGISADEAEQGLQRERFGRLWTDALHRAQRAVATERRGG